MLDETIDSDSEDDNIKLPEVLSFKVNYMDHKESLIVTDYLIQSFKFLTNLDLLIDSHLQMLGSKRYPSIENYYIKPILTEPVKKLLYPATGLRYRSRDAEVKIKTIAMYPNIYSEVKYQEYLKFLHQNDLKECSINMTANNPVLWSVKKYLKDINETEIIKYKKYIDHHILLDYYKEVGQHQLYFHELDLESFCEISNFSELVRQHCNFEDELELKLEKYFGILKANPVRRKIDKVFRGLTIDPRYDISFNNITPKQELFLITTPNHFRYGSNIMNILKKEITGASDEVLYEEWMKHWILFKNNPDKRKIGIFRHLELNLSVYQKGIASFLLFSNQNLNSNLKKSSNNKRSTEQEAIQKNSDNNNCNQIALGPNENEGTKRSSENVLIALENQPLSNASGELMEEREMNSEFSKHSNQRAKSSSKVSGTITKIEVPLSENIEIVLSEKSNFDNETNENSNNAFKNGNDDEPEKENSFELIEFGGKGTKSSKETNVGLNTIKIKESKSRNRTKNISKKFEKLVDLPKDSNSKNAIPAKHNLVANQRALEIETKVHVVDKRKLSRKFNDKDKSSNSERRKERESKEKEQRKMTSTDSNQRALNDVLHSKGIKSHNRYFEDKKELSSESSEMETKMAEIDKRKSSRKTKEKEKSRLTLPSNSKIIKEQESKVKEHESEKKKGKVNTSSKTIESNKRKSLRRVQEPTAKKVSANMIHRIRRRKKIEPKSKPKIMDSSSETSGAKSSLNESIEKSEYLKKVHSLQRIKESTTENKTTTRNSRKIKNQDILPHSSNDKFDDCNQRPNKRKSTKPIKHIPINTKEPQELYGIDFIINKYMSICTRTSKPVKVSKEEFADMKNLKRKQENEEIKKSRSKRNRSPQKKFQEGFKIEKNYKEKSSNITNNNKTTVSKSNRNQQAQNDCSENLKPSKFKLLEKVKKSIDHEKIKNRVSKVKSKNLGIKSIALERLNKIRNRKEKKNQEETSNKRQSPSAYKIPKKQKICHESTQQLSLSAAIFSEKILESDSSQTLSSSQKIMINSEETKKRIVKKLIKETNIERLAFWHFVENSKNTFSVSNWKTDKNVLIEKYITEKVLSKQKCPTGLTFSDGYCKEQLELEIEAYNVYKKFENFEKNSNNGRKFEGIGLIPAVNEFNTVEHNSFTDPLDHSQMILNLNAINEVMAGQDDQYLDSAAMKGCISSKNIYFTGNG